MSNLNSEGQMEWFCFIFQCLERLRLGIYFGWGQLWMIKYGFNERFFGSLKVYFVLYF